MSAKYVKNNDKELYSFFKLFMLFIIYMKLYEILWNIYEHSGITEDMIHFYKILYPQSCLVVLYICNIIILYPLRKYTPEAIC